MKLLELGEKPATQLAAELGIRRNQLRKWQEQMRSKGPQKAFRGAGAKPLSELSEVERLRGSVPVLRMFPQRRFDPGFRFTQ